MLETKNSQIRVVPIQSYALELMREKSRFRRIETNLVFFDVSGTGLSALDISARLRDKGIWIGASNEQRMRAVTHLDVARQDVIEASDALADILAG